MVGVLEDIWTAVCSILYSKFQNQKMQVAWSDEFHAHGLMFGLLVTKPADFTLGICLARCAHELLDIRCWIVKTLCSCNSYHNLQNWTELSVRDRPPVKSSHTACCIAGPATGQDHPLLMVIGGVDHSGTVFGDVWVLDLDSLVWTEVHVKGTTL